MQQEILAQRLFAKTENILIVLADNIKAPVAGWKDSIEFLHTQYKLNLLSTQQFIWLILLAMTGTVSAFFIGKKLTVTAPLKSIPKDSVSSFILAFRTSLARALPWLLPVGITASFLSFTLPLVPLPFIIKATYMLEIYLGLIVLINIREFKL